ncbi:uncharacterized protein MAL8P1.12-like [Calliphora vicina]|uniref:uncharacterized protein MAL8P1.12-like n=1 Tax=Calliphora vicina TaxID=7373 RepID=UPI00325BBC77
MTKEANKTKKITAKKSNLPSNLEFDAFLKNQQNIVMLLKTDLKSVISAVQDVDCLTAEKDKNILELEQSINQREAEINELKANLEQLQEENKQILLEFNLFKEKYFELETNYDQTLMQQMEETENLRQQLQTQQASENQLIRDLTLNCQELQQKLQHNIKEFIQLNQQHKETVQSFEQSKLDFEQQKNCFELYEKLVNEEKQLNEEKNKLDFDKLSEVLREKDELIKKCITDKNALEKEKNLIIDGLNNKIYRIEKAFSQPTKVVPPMVTLPQKVDNNTNSESSTENVAVSKPQVRKPLENLSNNENQKPEQNPSQRNYKFKRPIQPTTSSQQTNVVTNPNTNNRKRRIQPAKPEMIKSYNEFSLSSSDEDDDGDSNYNSFSQALWRPNNECYVADTDTSEGFAKPKRNKK